MTEDQVYYFDPNHGGCMRILTKIDKEHFIVQGAYGSDEGGKGHWVATMKKTKKFTYEGKPYNLIVDFSKDTQGNLLCFIGQTQHSLARWKHMDSNVRLMSRV